MTVPPVVPGPQARASGAADGGPAGSQAIPLLSSARLLGPVGEAVIEHDGQHYRLRRTTRGGLVLTK